MSACTTAAFSVAPFDQAGPGGCLWSSPSIPSEATSARSLPMCRPSIWMTNRSSLDRSDAIHSASRAADNATNRRDDVDFDVPPPATAGRSPSGSRTARLSFWRRYVDQHQVHRPAAKPVLGRGGGPRRQCNLMALVAAHARVPHDNLAAVEPTPGSCASSSRCALHRGCDARRAAAVRPCTAYAPSLRQTETLE